MLLVIHILHEWGFSGFDGGGGSGNPRVCGVAASDVTFRPVFYAQ